MLSRTVSESLFVHVDAVQVFDLAGVVKGSVELTPTLALAPEVTVILVGCVDLLGAVVLPESVAG